MVLTSSIQSVLQGLVWLMHEYQFLKCTMGYFYQNKTGLYKIYIIFDIKCFCSHKEFNILINVSCSLLGKDVRDSFNGIFLKTQLTRKNKLSSVDPEYIYFCEKLERRNVHGNIEYWLRLTGVNIFRTQRWLKEYAVQVSKLSLRRLVWQRPIFNHEQKLPSRENRFNVCVKLPTLFERISILTF